MDKPTFTLPPLKEENKKDMSVEGSLDSGNVNEARILGNVGKQPVLREGATGTKYATFSVATSKKTRQEGKGKTTWHNITVFGNTAEFVDKHVTKGSKVYVEGEIDNGSYEKDGKTVNFSKIIARNIQLVSKKEYPQ